jgi:hypothetical protein
MTAFQRATAVLCCCTLLLYLPFRHRKALIPDLERAFDLR